jgi:hypothetical protein
MENAQSNTMVCKGNMNFRVEGKKIAGGWGLPRLHQIP